MAIIKKSTHKNAREGVEKREPAYIIHGNVNWCSQYGKQYGGSLKELKIELPYDPAIPRVYIPRYTHSEKKKTQKDTCTSMFITALFTIANTQKQPKCPSINHCLIHTHTHTHTHKVECHSWKRMKDFHLQQHEQTLRTVCLVKYVRHRRTNMIHHLYVESKR